jgi:hypothetical protein
MLFTIINVDTKIQKYFKLNTTQYLHISDVCGIQWKDQGPGAYRSEVKFEQVSQSTSLT